MRFVVQVVTEASVISDGVLTGKIGKGLAVLVGIGPDDDDAVADKMVSKLTGLRIFKDGEGKTNLSVGDVGGGILLVSQFTLYADVRKGNRPNFINAADPAMAEKMYDMVVEKVRAVNDNVGTGVFGASMKLSLVNDGPFTVIIDSEDLNIKRR